MSNAPVPPSKVPATPASAPDGENAPWRGWALFLVVLVVVFGLGLLVASIQERRIEARPAAPAVALTTVDADNAKWRQGHEREYDSWKATSDEGRTPTTTRYGGSFKRDLLEETPDNVVLFAGYPFARDYKQARGHMHAVADVRETLRTKDPKDDSKWNEKFPGTCWTCKSPDVPRLMEQTSPEKFYETRMYKHDSEIKNPIGCLDCHDPATMALRISRPALREAYTAMGKDIDKASHQEMRSLVCAQCHVEYYFAKQPKDYLVFPWKNGLKIEDMEKTYDENGHVDWTHLVSRTRMIKMQHPDFEVYTQGIHHYRNVSCADCHMPYRTEGGRKFTDHHIQSPLNNIANSCAVCHRWSEEDIRNRVFGIQDKITEGRHRAEAALRHAHFDVAACMQIGASDDDLKPVRDLIRRSQMRWDYVAANNGVGFHAPQECQRILAAANDLAQQARLEAARILARKGFTGTVVYPDVSTKVKAQAVNKLFAAGTPPRLLPEGVATVPWPPAPAAPATAPTAPAAAPATAPAAPAQAATPADAPKPN